ncbi:type 1 glutamine amidotransferase [Deinococcota bacterium DY0809b]
MTLNFLIVNGYPRASRENFDRSDVAHPHDLYRRLLDRYAPGSSSQVFFIADVENPLPSLEEVRGFHGVIWTGSDQTIYRTHEEKVARQIAFARRAFEAGVPQFGSCWGAQMAAVAAGGRVEANPKGREWGFAPRIELTAAGREHPLTAGKPPVFQGIEMHLDHVTELPTDAELLATGEHTRVQALAVEHENGAYWATQYHPEFDLWENARLIAARAGALVKEGFFDKEEDVLRYAAKMKELFKNPGDEALRRKLGVDETLLDDRIRQLEFANWLEHLVRPAAS